MRHRASLRCVARATGASRLVLPSRAQQVSTSSTDVVQARLRLEHDVPSYGSRPLTRTCHGTRTLTCDVDAELIGHEVDDVGR